MLHVMKTTLGFKFPAIPYVLLLVLVFILSSNKPDVEDFTGTYKGTVQITFYRQNSGQDSIAVYHDVLIKVDGNPDNLLDISFTTAIPYRIGNVPPKIGSFQYSKESGRGQREDVWGSFTSNQINITSKGFYYPTSRYYQAVEVSAIKN